MRIVRVGLALLISLLIVGTPAGGIFASASPSSVPVTGAIFATAQGGSPAFIDLEAFSSNNVTVTAGDRVTVLVTAIYDGGAGPAIPCGDLNLGVVNDQEANFRDDAAGTWPESAWRSPNRVAADGCIGEAVIGTRVYWPVVLYVSPETPTGVHTVGTFSPVWDGVGWSTSQITISVDVGGSSGSAVTPTPSVAANSTPPITTTPPSAAESEAPLVSAAASSPVPLPSDDPGRLVVLVVDEASTPLLGTTCFEVYTDAGSGAWGTLITGGCDETDGADGTVTIEGLIAGNYVLVQNTPPDGYDRADDQQISIAPGEETRATIIQVPLETETAASDTGDSGDANAQTDAPESTPAEQGVVSTLPPEYAGTWQGSAIQVNPPDQFPLTITFIGGGIDEVVARVEYPSYACEGELRLDRVEPGSLQLTEQVTVGADICVDGGAITLALSSDGTMDFSWSSPEGSATANATLLPMDPSTDATSTDEPATPAVITEPAETETPPEPTESTEPVVESSASSLPPGYVGTWEGQGVQTNPDLEWPVTIAFTGGKVGEVVARAEYPSYDCSGELTLDRVEPGRGRVVLTEHITVGEDTCADGGSMAFYLEPDGTLTFAWSSADGSSTATATLDKVSDSPTNDDGSTAVESVPISQDDAPAPDPTESDTVVIQPVDESSTVAPPDENEVLGEPQATQPSDEPSASDEPDSADAQAAADAAVELSQLEAERNFDALYDSMHPDAQGIIPREVIVGWYEDYLSTQEAGELTVTNVSFVDWTWEVTSVTYPNTAEITFVQPFTVNGTSTEVTDTLRLVEDEGEWYWFFGRTRDFVDEQIEEHGLDASPNADAFLPPG